MGSPSIPAAPLEGAPLLDHKEDFITTAASTRTPLAAPPRSGPGPAPDSNPPARRFPQAIAHRGFKAAYPENTMAAFRAALAAGAPALETDLHLSRDGVVVLSHDATLARCFGRPDRLADLDWPVLAALRTSRAPRQPMPRLADLLALLAADPDPRARNAWVLLDLKTDDDAGALVRAVAAACAEQPLASGRVVLGCWNAGYIRLCQELLPGFPVAYIGWSLPYAQQLLKVPGVQFNLFQRMLVGPLGRRFLRQARERGRRVFVWTVNEEEWMDWSIAAGVDGVITDDPKLYLEVCRRWEDEEGKRGLLGGVVKGKGEGRDGANWWRHRRNLTGRERGWRRWAQLYSGVVFWQVLAMLIITLLRIPLGSERRRVARALRR